MRARVRARLLLQCAPVACGAATKTIVSCATSTGSRNVPPNFAARRTNCSARAFALLSLVLLVLLASCRRAEEPPAPEIRPVRVVTVAKGAVGDMIALTGTVQAQTEINLSFRIDGRLIERNVTRWRHGAAGPAHRPARFAKRGEQRPVRAGAARRGARAAGRSPQQLRAHARSRGRERSVARHVRLGRSRCRRPPSRKSSRCSRR